MYSTLITESSNYFFLLRKSEGSVKLMQFLGRKPSEEFVDKIIQHASFQMKNNPSTN